MKLADTREQEEAESKSERAGVRSVSVWADNLGNHMPTPPLSLFHFQSSRLYIYLP